MEIKNTSQHKQPAHTPHNPQALHPRLYHPWRTFLHILTTTYIPGTATMTPYPSYNTTLRRGSRPPTSTGYPTSPQITQSQSRRALLCGTILLPPFSLKNSLEYGFCMWSRLKSPNNKRVHNSLFRSILLPMDFFQEDKDPITKYITSLHSITSHRKNKRKGNRTTESPNPPSQTTLGSIVPPPTIETPPILVTSIYVNFPSNSDDDAKFCSNFDLYHLSPTTDTASATGIVSMTKIISKYNA